MNSLAINNTNCVISNADEGQWVTVGGRHIFIGKGATAKPVKAKASDVFYHGTTKARAKEILKRGLIPGKYKNYDYKALSKEGLHAEGSVYVTTSKSVAKAYAQDTSFFKGRNSPATILEIKIPKGTQLFKDLAPNTGRTGKNKSYFKLGKIPKDWVVSASVGHGYNYQIEDLEENQSEYLKIYTVVFLEPYSDLVE